MTLSLKHSFTSAKADGTDSTLVQPSAWNAEHTITLAAGKVLGRDSSGAGAAQELPLSFDTSGNVSMSATGYFIPAIGTTAQRPTGSAGMIRYNTSLSKIELYNGTAWGSVGGGATTSDTAPSSPASGDLWWKSDEGQLYIYYTDPSGSQWVTANSFAGGPSYLPLAGGTLTGALTGTTISDSIGNVRNVPANAQSAAYTLVATDNGKFIDITTGGVTIPSGVFSAGQSVTIYNDSASNQTITQGSGVTMYWVGTATTGNRTLAQRGLCTVFCVGANTFVITGGGLT